MANTAKTSIATVFGFVLFGTPILATGAAIEIYVPLGSVGEVAVVDADQDIVVRTIRGLPAVHGLSGTADGRVLVAGSYDETTGDNDPTVPTKPEGMAQSEHDAHHSKAAANDDGAGSLSYVTVIDNDNRATTRRVEVGGAVHHTAVAPDGRYAVATHPNQDMVSVIDLEAFKVVATIDAGSMPSYVAISSGGDLVYVSNAGNNTVSEIDTESWEVRRNFVAGVSPEHLVLSGDDRMLYVANVDDGSVSAINLLTGVVDETFDIGGLLHGIDLSNDGRRLFVSAREANKIAIVDLDKAAVSYQTLDSAPYHLATGGSSHKIYVSSAEEPKLWVLDSRTLAVLTEIPIKDIGHQMVVAPGSI